ncbi:MAG: GNAT family N-acetyltransferase [Chloroflexi bacterium]|nr:GNAT family N-acetyltransferase [Chloroflexota bacterium]MBC7256846.1 GNAT family N-acetyltransferase [Chloroflexota bacterium]
MNSPALSEEGEPAKPNFADAELTLLVCPGSDLSPTLQREIAALCSRAFEIDYTPYLATFPDPTHVLAFLGKRLASHALWVTRWLQQGHWLLRTAYVEGMVTEPTLQRRGYGTAVMRRLAQAVQAYDLGALSTSSVGFYARLGWELWRGPLFVRTEQGLKPCPEDRVMVLRLPNTPPLDIEGPLSAEWRPLDVW